MSLSTLVSCTLIGTTDRPAAGYPSYCTRNAGHIRQHYGGKFLSNSGGFHMTTDK